MNSDQMKAWDDVYDPIIQKLFMNHTCQERSLIRFKYQRYLQDYLACIAACKIKVWVRFWTILRKMAWIKIRL